MPRSTRWQAEGPSLAVGLSQLLVAYTIEYDNEAERRIHTADNRRPWLVSLAMSANFLRHVPTDGVPLDDVEDLVALTNLGGMVRWGYVSMDGGLIRLKPGGARAQRVWDGLAEEIEDRWRARFGGAVEDLAKVLPLGAGGPAYLPVVGYPDGMRTHAPEPRNREWGSDLSVRLAQALLSITLDYESRGKLSLPMVTDVIRVLDADGVRQADLPRRSGVSKEGLAAALGFLQRRELAEVVADPAGGRFKLVRLTARGQRPQASHARRLAAAEEDRPGAAEVAAILDHPLLAKGLEPTRDGWRANPPYKRQTEALLKDPRAALPQHPMVLHRGGFPDGS